MPAWRELLQTLMVALIWLTFFLCVFYIKKLTIKSKGKGKLFFCCFLFIQLLTEPPLHPQAVCCHHITLDVGGDMRLLRWNSALNVASALISEPNQHEMTSARCSNKNRSSCKPHGYKYCQISSTVAQQAPIYSSVHQNRLKIISIQWL